jgi:FemAB-related protein (PEP-CTERM system-associated)
MVSTIITDSKISTFIEEQAKGTSSYIQAWLDLLTRLYGYSAYPLVTTNGEGKITGFLPLCSMQSPLTGRRLVALPFTDLCPIIAEDEVSTHSLIDQAIRLAQQQKVKYLELRSGENDVLAKNSDLMKGDLYVRWLTPLVSDPNVVWSGLRKNVQQKVRKSQKLGVQVRITQKREDMAHFYRLHLLTRSKKHGMPGQPRRFFYELWDSFATSNALQLLLAEYHGTVIASTILLMYGTTVKYAYSASDEHYLHLAPNNLLLWKAITWCCSQGYQALDLGRTAQDNQGLMEFKRGWSAIKEPLPYYYYPHMAGLTSTSETSKKYYLLTSCWKRLPLQVTGPLGGYLYKHLG